MKQRLILASGSKQRKDLLKILNLPFVIIPADFDEQTIQNDDPKVRVEKLARAKAKKVAEKNPGVIIAADTFCFLNGKVFEKPKNRLQAKEMLTEQSGARINVYTGFCYLDKQNAIDFSTGLVIEVVFRKFTQREIEKYISQFPVTSWSGGFSPANLYTSTMIAEIDGSLTGFTHGLPMEHLIPLLNKSGYKVKP